MKAVLRAIDVKPPAKLVGHSIGGLIALESAADSRTWSMLLSY
ncbi:pimeloyl-ACP methyl ester carboxylesterase [Deinococcus humi]|uniref:Pimeloyl-ACP methyl ester carboxylesterase n=1 Tax=Deinococcus humi TaxID=662880 RepID=A0A7W8JSN4_9DEIO|nr:pimeloyl-ACP methyl ester carboxylesterase [Deinococcus humi]